MSDDADLRRQDQQRLWWRSRRGMLELDLLFMPFVEQRYAGLAAADQVTFRRLLEEDDPVLMEWCAGREIPEDPDYAHLIALIRGRV